MFEENPGVDLFHEDIYIVRSEESVRGMEDAISKMVNLALKLAGKETIGRPSEEGYFPRNLVKNELADRNAAERAVEMILRKVRGEPFQPELELPRFDRVKPATLGKPLAMPRSRSNRFTAYEVKGLDRLAPEDFEAIHGGYDTKFVDQDPNRLVPLDALREMERRGLVGEVHGRVYVKWRGGDW